jgi:hypothetical protein
VVATRSTAVRQRGLLGDEPGRDGRQGPGRDAEDHGVEVDAAAQREALGGRRSATRILEVEAGGGEPGAVDQLIPQRTVRPAALAGEVDQRVVGAVAERAGLAGELEAIDAATVGGGDQRVDPVEEAKLDAAGAQEPIERGDQHVAGAAAQLPAERALVRERGAQQAGEQGAGLVVGLRRAAFVAAGVAAAVGEGRVVDDAQEHRALEHAAVREHVRAQPGAEVEVVERLEAAGEGAVAEQADGDGGGEVEEDPQAARAVLGERVAQGQPGAAAGELEGADGERDRRAPGEPGELVPPWPIGHVLRDKSQEAGEGGRDDAQRGPHGQRLGPRRGGRRVDARTVVVGGVQAQEVEGEPDRLGEGELAVVAGDPRVGRVVDVPGARLAVDLLDEDRGALGADGVHEVAEVDAVAGPQLVVDAAHEAKGVVVEAEQVVQAVLLDAAVGGGVEAAAAGSLAAEAPAELVDRDGEAVGVRAFRVGEGDGGREGPHAAAEDRYADPRVGRGVSGYGG